MNRLGRWRQAARYSCVAAAAIVLAACGGDGGSTPAPSPTPTPPPAGTTTITITSTGTSPRDVTVSVGSRVTFINNDSRPHDMSSDPHPAHTDCPDVTVGLVQPGQNRTTNNLNTARSCGYHDHDQPSNTNLQGTIRIQ